MHKALKEANEMHEGNEIFTDMVLYRLYYTLDVLYIGCTRDG